MFSIQPPATHPGKAEATDPRSAWLGDRLNDAYLAMQGVTHRLTPHQMDQMHGKS